jgi:class 3 adenylate cyclase
MTDAPETRYTRSADGTNLAFHLSGGGPLDLVFNNASGVPIDLLSEDRGFVRLRKRLDTFSRTVWFDRRGWGASEGDIRDDLRGEISDADLIAVLDAVDFQRPALVAEGFSGGSVIHFSATHPERVSALVLVNTFGHYVREDGYSWGILPESLDRLVAYVKETWGTAAPLEFLAPSRMADERFRAWFARSARSTGGPDQTADIVRASFEHDVRPLLPSISVPTLVLHREGDRFIHLGAGQYLAEHIPASRLVVLPGDDHLFFVGDTDALVDEIEEFLTGERPPVEVDRILTTVLFVDIVASTERAAALGDQRWSELLSAHHKIVRSELHHFRGLEIDTTGDGFLASFDGPARAIRCACAIRDGVEGLGLQIRAGLHTGEVELSDSGPRGLAVHIGARVGALAGPGEVLISRTVADLVVGSGIKLADRGEHRLKGVPGRWRLFAVAT